MIINLDETWFLDCDATNVVLTERRIITGDNTKGIKAKAENIGKERLVQHGFYGTIAQAAQAYLNKSVAGMDGMLAATAVIAAWNDCTARIEAACKDIPRRGYQEDVQSEPRNRTAPPTQEYAVVGHKGPQEFHSGIMVSDGNGGVITLPLKSPEPLYSLPQVDL